MAKGHGTGRQPTGMGKIKADGDMGRASFKAGLPMAVFFKLKGFGRHLGALGQNKPDKTPCHKTGVLIPFKSVPVYFGSFFLTGDRPIGGKQGRVLYLAGYCIKKMDFSGL
jgi:hypothetical protein